MPTRRFDSDEFLPRKLVSQITELRVRKPDLAQSIASRRKRRTRFTIDGRLTMLAADHPARMVTAIRDEPLRMGRRREFLARVARVMASSPFDGVMGTADVLEELLLLSGQGPGRSLLDGRLLVGSVNRGGFAGSSSELDDMATGYDALGITQMRLDGAKFLWRHNPEDKGSAKTLDYCVRSMRDCTRMKIPFFLEPLPVSRVDGKWKTDKDKDKLVSIVGAASALASSSARVWLKLPFCKGFEDVAAATTLPILLLGGEASDDVLGLLGEIEEAMKAGPNVRGVMMGRNLLYPSEGDPLPLAMAVDGVVHRGMTAKDAARAMADWDGKGLDYFSSND